MAETKAGSKPGKMLHGLSLKRAGNTHVEATGSMGCYGESPKVPKGHSFDSPGTKRKGDNTIQATGRPGVAGQCPTMHG